jgi:GTP-binding protein TrmE N-terminus
MTWTKKCRGVVTCGHVLYSNLAAFAFASTFCTYSPNNARLPNGPPPPLLRCIPETPHASTASRLFTTEDILEFNVHGGRAIINAVLTMLGRIPVCHLASPGEFTRRVHEQRHTRVPRAEFVLLIIKYRRHVPLHHLQTQPRYG